MRRPGWFKVVLVLLAGWGAAARAEPMSAGPWAAVSLPTAEAPSSIGGAAAGCLTGAVALSERTAGLQILRPQRNRFWSHPRTIAYLEGLGREAERQGLAPLLIGDMSQPRGGPMAFGHGSHQNGLDVDIWFRLPGKPLGEAERATPVAVSMVRGTRVNARAWSGRQFRLLQLAASAPEVDRIFVNPAIKAAACKAGGGQAAWLGKLRPWWGHDEHFHVRLSCAPGDFNCQQQAPVPSGSGCGDELASWLRKPTLLPKTGHDKANERRPDLPTACNRVLAEPAPPREARVR